MGVCFSTAAESALLRGRASEVMSVCLLGNEAADEMINCQGNDFSQAHILRQAVH
jgi:hypothetical protein